MEQNVIKHMALLRVVSGLLEILTAVLIVRLGRIDLALRLNALLGLCGPVIFILVSALGIAAIAVKVSMLKVGLLSLGIILVVLGTKI
ncbi:MAG: DUF2619 domain-containing protein [Bacillota bacterium]|jgi:hypothetical protein